MTTSSSKSNPRLWLTTIALILLCAIPLFHSYPIRNRPLGEDEIYWIGQAYYYHLAIAKLDWSNPDWQLLPARENPVIGKFIIGLGLQLDGLSVDKPDWLGIFYIIARDRPNAWGGERDRAERQAVLDRMQPATRELAITEGKFEYPPQYALAARAGMMFFGMLAVLLIFILTALYARLPTAFIAALLFALHPAVVAASTEVGVDILALVFSLFAVVCFVLMERRVWHGWKRPRLWRTLIWVGGAVSVAFAIGSKMNALIVAGLGFVLFARSAEVFLRRRSAASKERAWIMAMLLAVAMVIFVATNPVNYPDPVKGIWSVFADQQRSLEVQKGIPAVHQPLSSVGAKIQALAGLIAFYPAAFGLVVAAFLVVTVRRRGETSKSVIALWWLMAVGMVTGWLPFARLRYVLPVVAPSVILVCLGAETLAGWTRRKIKTSRAPAPET